MLLWHKDFFEVKAIERKQTQEKLSDPLLSTRKGMMIISNQRLYILLAERQIVPQESTPETLLK